MDRIYEDLKRVMENRRIRSAILQQDKYESLIRRYPKLAEIEQRIAQTTEDALLMSLDGVRDDSLPKKLEKLEEERRKILVDCQLTEEDLKVQPNCPICDDTGYVTVKSPDGKEREEFCTCTRSLLAPAMLRRSGVEKYPDFSFEKGKSSFYPEDSAMKELYEKIEKVAKKCRVPNCVFFGTSGKGKTFLAVAIAREYAGQGRSALVIRQAEALEVMQEHRKVIGSYYTPSQKENEIEARREYLTEAEILVLDDLGVEPRTPNSQSDLIYILDERVLSGKTTIITTNYDMDSLKERYGGRIFERLDRDFSKFRFNEKTEGDRA